MLGFVPNSQNSSGEIKVKGASFVIHNMPLSATVYVNEVSFGKPSGQRLVARRTNHLPESWNFQSHSGPLGREERLEVDFIHQRPTIF